MGKSPSTYRNLILLNIVVLVFGFTGILGKLITIPAEELVWHRMLIATISIGIYFFLSKKSIRISRRGLFHTTLTGLIIATHWILFFESIHQANVSIALAALSASSLFTAVLEPIFFKRRFKAYELLLGFIVILGLYFILKFEAKNNFGFYLGIAAAFLASLFTVINGKLVEKHPPSRITFYELSGGLVAITLYFLLSGGQSKIHFDLGASNWVYLLILSTICTAFAFIASVEVMKELKPFTVSLAINLEPIYGILLALIIFGEDEQLSSGFYIGTSIVLSAIFANVFIKRSQARKLRQVVNNK